MKKLFLKMSLVILCLLMLVVTMAACGGNESKDNAQTEKGVSQTESDTEEKSETTKVRTINKLVFSSLGSEEELEEKLWNEIIQNYMQKTGMDIEWIQMPFDQYRTWQTVQFAANSAPDVQFTQVNNSWDDYYKGNIIALNDFLEKENPYLPGKPWKETISQTILRQAYDDSNGIISGIPYNVVVVRMFYNKDLFDKAGIKGVPKTWSEFMEVQQTLQSAGIIPVAFAHSKLTDVHHLWIANSLTGQLCHDAIIKKADYDASGMVSKNEMAKATDNGLINFTKEPLKDVFTMIKDWSQYWSPDFNSMDRDTAIQMWARQEVAMTLAGSWRQKSIEELEGLNFKYGVFPIPAVMKDTNPNAREQSIVLGGRAVDTYCLNAKTEDVNASVDFIQYLMSAEVHKKFAENIYQISTLVGTEMPDKLQGFAVENEDILRINFFANNTDKELADFIARSSQLYYVGDITLDELTREIQDKYEEFVVRIKELGGWTKENDYGMKKQ